MRFSSHFLSAWFASIYLVQVVHSSFLASHFASVAPGRTDCSSHDRLFQVSQSGEPSTLIWTQEQLEDFASREGVVLTFSTLGPGFRAVARSKVNTTSILGYAEGFIRPSGKMQHVDKMEVFAPTVKKARKENPEFRGGGTIFGVGLLVGYLCLLHAYDKGCTEAEFLAIDDEEKQHRRLVRYYANSGFEVIRYVGDGVRDIPDRLVWGGCGTLMRQDIDVLLKSWTQLLVKSQARDSERMAKKV